MLLVLCCLPTALAADPSDRWFSLDTTADQGLAPPTRALDLETPQSALESFVAAARSGRPGDAAHVLDLRDIPRGDLPDRAIELAERLDAVLDRRVWNPWDRLLDRPDGMPTDSKDNPMAGSPRRSIRIALIDIDGVPHAIRLNRVKPTDGPAVWRFSRQTVDNIDPLFEAYGPTAFELWIPDPLRGSAFWGLKWWEIIAIPVMLLLALGAALLVFRGLGRLRRRDDTLGDFADGLRVPGALAAATVVLWIITTVVTFSGPFNVVFDPAIATLLMVAITLVVVRLIDAGVQATLTDGVDDLSDVENADARETYTNLSAFRRMLLLIGMTAGLGVVLSQTNLFANLGLSLVASASVLGIVLGFAGRTVLSNIMASLQIAFSKNARLGDQLIFDGYLCYVEKIHFTYVQLRTWDDRRLIVPVTELTSQTFENLSSVTPETIRSIRFELDPRADPELLRDAYESFLDGEERADDHREFIIVDHSPHSVTLRAELPLSVGEHRLGRPGRPARTSPGRGPQAGGRWTGDLPDPAREPHELRRPGETGALLTRHRPHGGGGRSHSLRASDGCGTTGTP